MWNRASSYGLGGSGYVHKDVRGVKTAIVEGPTERRKKRLGLRETGDGPTGI